MTKFWNSTECEGKARFGSHWPQPLNPTWPNQPVYDEQKAATAMPSMGGEMGDARGMTYLSPWSVIMRTMLCFNARSLCFTGLVRQ